MLSPDAGRAASRALHRAAWLLHAHVVETKLQALREAVENKYDPNQPRVPAGNPDGGQWTRVGDGTGGRLPSGPGTLLDVDDGESERIRLAQNDPPDQRRDIPHIPRKRPQDIKERNRGARVLARFILKQIRKERLGRLIGHWMLWRLPTGSERSTRILCRRISIHPRRLRNYSALSSRRLRARKSTI